MIYLWGIPDNYVMERIGEYERAISPDRFLFLEGREVDIPRRPPSFRFASTKSALRQFDVLPNNSGSPLLSSRAFTLLTAKSPSDVQWVPARVSAMDGMVQGYGVLNITSQVDAIDLPLSDFIPVPGTNAIMKVNSVTLTRSALGPSHLARERCYLPYLWVSQDIADMFEREGIQACTFTPAAAIHP